MSILSHLKDKIASAKTTRDYLRDEYVELKNKLRELQKEKEHIEEAQIIIQQVAKQTQEELEYSLSEIVYLAMSIVFNRPYSLSLKWIEKRGKTDCKLRLEKNGKLYMPEYNSNGMVNISGNSLRYAVWNILNQTQNIRKVMILDEPFPGLKGKKANTRALRMVKWITKPPPKGLGLQVIMISDERIKRKTIFKIADKVFETKQVNGFTKLIEY